jgi:hypothetical protein
MGGSMTREFIEGSKKRMVEQWQTRFRKQGYKADIK